MNTLRLEAGMEVTVKHGYELDGNVEYKPAVVERVTATMAFVGGNRFRRDVTMQENGVGYLQLVKPRMWAPTVTVRAQK